LLRTRDDPSFGFVSHMIIIIISQVLSGVALVSYRAANVPKDKEHPYGYLFSSLSFDVNTL